MIYQSYSKEALQSSTSNENKFLTRLVNYYQTKISNQTIERCPYKTSCSNFLLKCSERKGLVIGVLSTVDRYYYRENVNAFQYYIQSFNEKNQIKLDDDYFYSNDLLKCTINSVSIELSKHIVEKQDSLFNIFKFKPEYSILYLENQKKYVTGSDKFVIHYMLSKLYLLKGDYLEAMLNALYIIEKAPSDSSIKHKAVHLLKLIHLSQQVPIKTTLYLSEYDSNCSVCKEIRILDLGFQNDWKEYFKATRQFIKSDVVNSDEVYTSFRRKLVSPTLSITFSAIIPGSGQMYCRHYLDGIQAFILISAFATASFASYQYESHLNKKLILTPIMVSTTSVFYFANLIGAYQTAQYRNMKVKKDALSRQFEKVWEILD